MTAVLSSTILTIAWIVGAPLLHVVPDTCSARHAAKRTTEPRTLADRPGWWEKVLFGTRGDPAKRPPPVVEEVPPEPVSRYVPPEEWVDNRTDAELRRDQQMQFDALREGNAMRQNGILGREIGKG